jgi:hypothetical protein
MHSPDILINAFVNELQTAYRCLELEEALFSENDNVKLLKANNFTWKTIQVSLTYTVLSHLAKLTEIKMGDNQEVASIYYLLGLKMNPYKGTVMKLKELRNNFLMHISANAHLNDAEKFYKKLDLTRKEIRELMDGLFYLLNLIKLDSIEFKQTDFILLKKGLQQEAIRDAKELLKLYK